MRGKSLIMTSALLAGLALLPGAVAAPEPPECYDRQPLVDAGVVTVGLHRDCSLDVDVHPPRTGPAPHVDVYLPLKAPSPDPCPPGFSGEYVQRVDTAAVDVYVWTCTYDPGVPP